MLFAILCEDKPGALELRMETRPAHLDYLKSLGGTLKFAGPFLTEKEQTPCGSLVVIGGAEEMTPHVRDALCKIVLKKL